MSISYLKSLLFRSSPINVTSEPWLVPEKDTTEVLTLPDGRKLGYSQYGLSTGKPIFYCHGLPGSRVEAGHLHEAALEAGARIIATDRPGMGLSTFQPGRTLLDHPKDLEHLANHLKIEKYGVMGVSGGGPFALACARTMARDKLKAVAIVCGIGPPDIGMSGAAWFQWLGFTYGWRYSPRLAGWFFHQQGQFYLTDEQRLQLRLQEAEKNKANFPRQELGLWLDKEIVARMVMASRQYYRQGIEGVSHDGYLCGTEFGFDIADIRTDLPMRLWYGQHDTHVPPNHGVQIAKRLGEHACLRLEDETHASIFFRRRKEVLADLVTYI
ncbi:alpha beta hydrolase fold protein [Colletotrichum truncatum]|uniref:Alpha beta hydrolase fold protein n=1 Tax=Colletotrichum truncatum TaxID=5467 RepID=A0ACC3Z4Z5_COLTU|nr:alpha beta hydrolase fold protein [Colletotrichum truncatum]KAF6780866.1 alpha beta hydrolase fold protein [Colletotrichum truncatum]